METLRPYYLSLKTAREFMKSDDERLKNIARAVFGKRVLYDFSQIKSLKDACEALDLPYTEIRETVQEIAQVSIASAAMFKLNIIRKALNLNSIIKVNKGDIYYPHIMLVRKEDECLNKLVLESTGGSSLGIFEVHNEMFYVIGGMCSLSSTLGVGNWTHKTGIGTLCYLGCLGCSSREIARHFSKYFGILIIEAQVGDLEGYKRCL